MSPSPAPRKPTFAPSPQRDWKGAGFLTVAGAAKLLHTTRKGVEYLCRIGALQFQRGHDGWKWFDPGEVKACAAARGIEAPYSGRTCARVFEMFDEGTPLPTIVKDLAILPEQVRKLWLEYVTPLGRDVPRMARFRTKEDKDAERAHAATMADLDKQIAQLVGLDMAAPAADSGVVPIGAAGEASGASRRSGKERRSR